MDLLEKLWHDQADGRIETIYAGAFWTAVVVVRDGQRSCGVASNPIKSHDDPEFLARLEALRRQSARSVCRLASRHDSPLASVGLAAINALLPRQPERWQERNALEVIAARGRGKRVALVGHFPFVPELRPRVGELQVLELNPQDGDYPASAAPHIIPEAEVVAITSMTFINGTLEGLLKLCSERSFVLVLGPSTPLSPILLEHGIDMLCGCVVEEIDPVLAAVANGLRFKQIKQHGVRLVTIEK